MRSFRSAILRMLQLLILVTVFARTGLGGTTRYTNTTSAHPFDIPSTGTGAAYASACNAAKVSWVTLGGSSFISSRVFETSFQTTSLHYGDYSFAVFTSLTNSTPYTLCDGYPRLDGRTCSQSLQIQLPSLRLPQYRKT